MPRIRDLGIYDGRLPPGKQNAITDVAGVAVGHHTYKSEDGRYRTGVTAVLPHTGNLFAEKVPAAVHTINGYGKAIGFEQVRELGVLETPIALTGTLNAPRVADALITLAIAQNPDLTSVNPVVGETNDAFLSDIQARPMGYDQVATAVATATSGMIEEGAVGAGTGTSCFGWKGGIGTASRVLSDEAGGYTIGALVQTNFGAPRDLMIAGVPVGQHLQPPPPDHLQDGSIMIILATDLPVDSHQLERLCKRAVFGLARTGSTGHHGSGDFVIAFSTAGRVSQRPLLATHRKILNISPIFNLLSLAVIESVEEAIYNSLFMAQTTHGFKGHVRHALPIDPVFALIKNQQ